MRAVVDEGVPFRLAGELRNLGLDVSDFRVDWRGLQNGLLLRRVVEAGFECLLTSDKNLRHQQNLATWKLAIIVLPKSRFDEIVPYLDRIVAAAGLCQPGRAFVISPDGQDELI